MNILVRIDLDKPKPDQVWQIPEGARTISAESGRPNLGEGRRTI